MNSHLQSLHLLWRCELTANALFPIPLDRLLKIFFQFWGEGSRWWRTSSSQNLLSWFSPTYLSISKHFSRIKLYWLMLLKTITTIAGTISWAWFITAHFLLPSLSPLHSRFSSPGAPGHQGFAIPLTALPHWNLLLHWKLLVWSLPAMLGPRVFQGHYQQTNKLDL
jgi:hypothetical protein